MPLLGVEKSFLKKIKRIFVQTIDFFLCKKCRGKFPRWTLKTESLSIPCPLLTGLSSTIERVTMNE